MASCEEQGREKSTDDVMERDFDGSGASEVVLAARLEEKERK